MRVHLRSTCVLLTFALAPLMAAFSPAQDAVVAPGGAAAPASTPTTPGQPATGQPAQPGKPGAASPDDAKKKAEGADAEKKKKKEEAAQPKIITRSEKPETPADPAQLDVEPNAEGKVRFNFEGQPWPAVLEWLARVSHLSLDWQELPGDYLNLHTEREYTLDEARDLINRHLLARGFTMLKEGELLTVANISKINVALVPRVLPEELAQRMEYEFVKTSFALEWMLAGQAVEELKPMLSPNGKLTALKGINRVEAMDAVTNLRDIYQMLEQEQSKDANDTSIIRVFKLEHRRASEVVGGLYDILGLDKSKLASSGGGGAMSDGMSRQILQQVQQMQQLLQQNRNNQQAGGAAGGGPPVEPRLIVNDRENCIIAHAPPDKMEIIAQTIKAFDVPGESASALLQNMSRMKVYRLATLDPQPLMQILTELGDLSPQSRVQVDEKNRSLIVYGTLADHYTIQTLVERLDGSSRSFEVIQLRRVRADAVSGTIKYMFGVEEDDKKDNNRSRYYGYYSYGYGMDSRKQEEEQRPFRVDADVDKNRLLVWANEIEMEEVRNLLVKLGELPPGTSNPQTLRAFELNSEEEADKILERIKQLWPQMNPNELKVQPAPQRPERATSVPSASLDGPRSDLSESGPVHNRFAAPVRLAFALPEENGESTDSPHPLTESEPAETGAAAAEAQFAEGNAPVDLEQEYLRRQARQEQKEAPPIVIQRAPDGRLLFSSPDTAALDRLEELLTDIAPPRRDYKIFHLKYPTTWAYGIEYNLKEYFKESGDEQSFLDWYGYSVTVNEQGPSRMSRRKTLKIISDEDSHTVLVSGATPEQLELIEELIAVYDQPSSSDPQSLRKTEMFQLKFSKAVTVAETVKQVYRDLLSANDPALQGNNGKEQKPSEGPSFTYVYGRGNDGQQTEEPPQPIRFKGLLSVGVDELSNTVVVSAMDGLMPDIAELINRLDEAARPTTTVQVLEINNLDPSFLKERLEGAFGIGAKVKTSQTAGQNVNGNGNQQQMQQQQQGNQNNGGQNQPAAIGQ